MSRQNLLHPLIPLLLFFCTHLQANSELNRVLALEEAPDGVVFEIVEGDAGALNWAIPKTVEMIERLRERFPGLPVAVVSHGAEQFALKSEAAEDYRPVHDAVRSLSGEQEVEVHVCGAHASWYDVDESDFPDYVDVVPAGPVQIKQYRELGYQLILVQ